jgi:hypothetical protein
MVDSDGIRFAAIVETTSFLYHFKELPEHRQAGKVDYPLPKVLLLILLAVLAGAEAFTDIARFDERKIELLRRNYSPARHQWPGLKAVVVVESQREINGKITNETRFYITSLVLLANALGPMIRAHWAIENSLHYRG